MGYRDWQSKRRGREDDEYRAYRGSAWQARPQSARLGSGRELWPDVALWDSPYGVIPSSRDLEKLDAVLSTNDLFFNRYTVLHEPLAKLRGKYDRRWRAILSPIILSSRRFQRSLRLKVSRTLSRILRRRSVRTGIPN